MIRLALAVVFALLGAPAFADGVQKAAPQSPAQVRLSFAPVVKKVAPAVVNVYASRVEAMPRNPLFDDPIFRRFFGSGGSEDQRVQKALGSGVLIDPSGLVVTNYHVIENMTDVRVALADKREFDAEIALRDPRTDLAVLRIKGGDNFPVLEMGDSDALEVGDFVIAIGDPFGVGQTVTQGIVSALSRTQIGSSDYGFFIQTDAAINPGNSGGALVDLDGRLVGINSMIYSRSGGSMGLGFAIPVNMVKGVVAAALHGGKTVKRPWLGATLQNVSKDIAENLGLERPTGALVVDVVEPGPAAAAGLKRGDVIAAIDSQAVDDAESVGFRLGVKPLGGSARTHGPEERPDPRHAAETRLRAGNSAARRADHPRPFPLRRRRGVEPVAGGGGGAVAPGGERGRRRRRRRRRLDRRSGRRVEGRRRRRGERPADRDNSRSREGLRGAGALVGPDDPARQRYDPHAPRRLSRDKKSRALGKRPAKTREWGGASRFFVLRGLAGGRPRPDPGEAAADREPEGALRVHVDDADFLLHFLCAATARDEAIVLLPEPPFWATNAIVRMSFPPQHTFGLRRASWPRVNEPFQVLAKRRFSKNLSQIGAAGGSRLSAEATGNRVNPHREKSNLWASRLRRA